jgi:hypothetical protein
MMLILHAATYIDRMEESEPQKRVLGSWKGEMNSYLVDRTEAYVRTPQTWHGRGVVGFLLDRFDPALNFYRYTSCIFAWHNCMSSQCGDVLGLFWQYVVKHRKIRRWHGAVGMFIYFPCGWLGAPISRRVITCVLESDNEWALTEKESQKGKSQNDQSIWHSNSVGDLW